MAGSKAASRQPCHWSSSWELSFQSTNKKQSANSKWQQLFETSNPALSGILSPAKLHFLIFLTGHQLGTKYSNAWDTQGQLIPTTICNTALLQSHAIVSNMGAERKDLEAVPQCVVLDGLYYIDQASLKLGHLLVSASQGVSHHSWAQACFYQIHCLSWLDPWWPSLNGSTWQEWLIDLISQDYV